MLTYPSLTISPMQMISPMNCLIATQHASIKHCFRLYELPTYCRCETGHSQSLGPSLKPGFANIFWRIASPLTDNASTVGVAYTVDLAVNACVRTVRLTRPLRTITMYDNCFLALSGLLFQLSSEYALSLNIPRLQVMLKPTVPDRYRP